MPLPAPVAPAWRRYDWPEPWLAGYARIHIEAGKVARTEVIVAQPASVTYYILPPRGAEVRLEVVARDEAELVMLLELVDRTTRELLRRVWIWRAGVLLDQAEQARRAIIQRAAVVAPLAIEG